VARYSNRPPGHYDVLRAEHEKASSEFRDGLNQLKQQAQNTREQPQAARGLLRDWPESARMDQQGPHALRTHLALNKNAFAQEAAARRDSIHRDPSQEPSQPGNQQSPNRQNQNSAPEKQRTDDIER
jgi:hypothetical protein